MNIDLTGLDGMGTSLDCEQSLRELNQSDVMDPSDREADSVAEIWQLGSNGAARSFDAVRVVQRGGRQGRGGACNEHCRKEAHQIYS